MGGLRAAIFLVSAATLLFQVAQTRLFSAALGYHLTYLVISVSLLGVGAGATFSAVVDRRAARPPRWILALALGASCLVALFAETHIDPVAAGLATVVIAAYVVGALPFVFASWIVVRSLREDPRHGGQLYAADLAGAALGSVVAYLGISAIGVPALYGVAALLASLGAVILRPRARSLAAAPALAVAAVIALALWGDVLAQPKLGPQKVLDVFDPQAIRQDTRWDPNARVDVVSTQDAADSTPYLFLMDPGYSGARPPAIQMYLDLGVSTPILRGDGDMRALAASVIAAPYAIVDRPRVLVIGPGGGIDIQNALTHGASTIDAVEVNRGVVDSMRSTLGPYSGDLYREARVSVFEDEARSFIRRSHERYGVIVMTVVDSWAALASGSYGLTESYLYTQEAFTDYIEHLDTGGVLAVGRWYREPPIEMLRTAQVADRGFRAAGVVDAARHLLVLRHGNFGLLLARRDAFGAVEVAAVRRFADEHHFVITYDPLAPAPPFSDALADRAAAPSTDDRPFFFAYYADDLSRMGGSEFLPFAYAILALAFLPAFVLSYFCILLPQRRISADALVGSIARLTTVHSLAVGLGFIAAEIVLLQRLTLYLGQPALALAWGLAALLLGAAAGAALSTRARGGVSGAALASAVALAAVLVALGWVSDATLSWPLAGRLAVAALGGGLAGLPLGVVFPRILARAAARDDALVPWAWAVNGTASVIGSIVAVALSLAFGFAAVAVYAVACYAFVSASGAMLSRSTSALLIAKDRFSR